MRRYEMVFVADPTIPEANHDRLITAFEELIAEEGGVVHKVDRWGRRKLAYPIKKHKEGNYTVMLFDAEPALEKELLRRMKLSDNWLRFLSVRADEQAPPSDEEKDALVEARKEYLRRAAEREAAAAAGIILAEKSAAEAARDATAPDVGSEACELVEDAAEGIVEEIENAAAETADAAMNDADEAPSGVSEETTDVASEAPAANGGEKE